MKVLSTRMLEMSEEIENTQELDLQKALTVLEGIMNGAERDSDRIAAAKEWTTLKGIREVKLAVDNTFKVPSFADLYKAIDEGQI